VCLKNLFIYLLKIKFFIYFDMLILKNKKNIILIYFSIKNILKNNRNYTFKAKRSIDAIG
jgi:hypothetical protein